MSSQSQSVVGFRVSNFQVKKSKDSETIKLILEADVGDVKAGEFEVGDILKALLAHQTGDVDIGISVFVDK